MDSNVGFLIQTEVRLKELITECIRQELSTVKLTGNEMCPDQTQLLSRKEAAAFLSISLTQLYHLQRKSLVKFYRLGCKVFFKKEDLLNSLVPAPAKIEGGRDGKK